jgi:ligand-binding sensor domain-containing protein
MKKSLLLLFFFIFPVDSAHSQMLSKYGYKFQSLPTPGLESNSITDLVVVDENTIWLGTGKGLSKTEDGGSTWQTFTEKDGIGRGGVSALAVTESAVWVSTAFDTLIAGEHEAAGGGLSYSTDNGKTWTYIDQPFPMSDWTIINNVTYDFAIIDSTVWIASFGGGLIKSIDMGKTWAVRPPDNYNFNPDQYLNHRVFSLLAIGDTLWVGTAEGINVSYDAGKTWNTQFTHQNEDQPISGNFVVSLAVQQIGDRQIIWAGTANAEDPDEVRATSWTKDGGLTWQTGLEGKFTWNFAFDGEIVYACTDSGFWKSPDEGGSWDVFPQIVDDVTMEKFYTIEYYSVGLTPNKNLWVGSADGLAYTMDNGQTWDIFRAFVKPGVDGEPRVYAYPNPFTPLRQNQFGGDGFIRFQFNSTTPTRAKVRIFDFAMDLVTTVDEGKTYPAGNWAIPWDGKTTDGKLLANGVYFYQLDINDGKYWGKILIVD